MKKKKEIKLIAGFMITMSAKIYLLKKKVLPTERELKLLIEYKKQIRSLVFDF